MTSQRTEKEENQRINQLLLDWSEGNLTAQAEIMQSLYPVLHTIAHKHFKSQNDNTFQTTEIVNEAFIKLNDKKTHDWKSKAHFLCFASKVIRSIVIDHYRSLQSQKRGGGQLRITYERLDTMIDSPAVHAHDWLDLDSMLKALEQHDQQTAQVVELKVFGGLTIPEMAICLDISESSVVRNWSFARSWLLMQLK